MLPTEQFTVKVTDRPETIALGLHASGLSVNQELSLAQFVSRWRGDGGGVVTLQAPSNGPDPTAARRQEDQAAAYLRRIGVPAEQVRVAGYLATAPASPLLVSYQRFEALGPNCSAGWKDVTTTGGNAPYDHFGCANTGNLAAMVANPRDFLAPAVETPADDSRRQVVFGHYRRGELTSSVADPQASGHASDTGSN